MTARDAYYFHLAQPSDIQHHLPLLYSLARGNVLELGTRTGVSTAALLAGVEARSGHVWSVDLDDCSKLYAGHPQWTCIQGDSRDQQGVWSSIRQQRPDVPIQWFDMALIDTEHTVEQVAAELETWAPCIVPGGTICVHDIETFPGVRRAVNDFCAAKGWAVTFVLPCNGMAVIEVPQ
jgi:cephalosporin hydroxylase